MLKYIRFIRVMIKHSRLLFWGVIVVNICIGLSTPFLAFLLKRLIMTFGNSINEIVIWLICYISLLLVYSILPDLNKYAFERLQERLSKSFAVEIIEKLKELEYAHFEDEKFLDNIHRISKPGEQCAMLLGTCFSLMQQVISLLGMVYLFFNISWVFSIVILVIFVISLKYNLREVGNLKKLRIAHTPISRMSDYISELFTKIDSIKEIKVFGAKNYLLEKYNTVNRKMIDERTGIRRKSFKEGVLSLGIDLVFSTATLWILVEMAYNGKINIAEVISLSTLLPTICLIASWYIPSYLINIKEQAEFWDSYERLVAIMPHIEEKHVFNLKHGVFSIEFRNVWFKYPGQNTYVLAGFNANFKQGERIAIVGVNGSGKSTIVKLMLGLYNIEKGEILLNGVNIAKFSREEIRGIFSVCMQKYCIYMGTVRENLELYSKNNNSDDILMQCLAKVGFENSDIALDYDITLTDNSTTNLSIGQEHKIALARTIAADAKCIIMDEPTANIDPNTENHFYNYILNDLTNKTVIVISHRLAIAKFVDRIIVIEKGRVAEEGSFTQLYDNGGLFTRMYDAQASLYKR